MLYLNVRNYKQSFFSISPISSHLQLQNGIRNKWSKIQHNNIVTYHSILWSLPKGRKKFVMRDQTKNASNLFKRRKKKFQSKYLRIRDHKTQFQKYLFHLQWCFLFFFFFFFLTYKPPPISKLNLPIKL